MTECLSVREVIIQSEFKAAWWLQNRHVQTFYRTLFRRPQVVVDYSERLELPDGDFIDLAWAINGVDRHAPLIILLHGMGGSVHSSYVSGLLQAFNAAGYRAVLMHFRGASHEANRLPRTYHSGDTADLDYFLKLLQQREPLTSKAAVGISLGGNVLLKWLGETGRQSLLQAAVAVSVPFQLNDVAESINKGFARVYQAYLLQGLRAVFMKKLAIVNQQLALTPAKLRALKTIRQFDQQITAPLHGFTSEHAYYAACSSRQYLSDITTPTLIIHALDDPFMSPSVIPTAAELSKEVIFELSHQGGHVGFIAGGALHKPVYWLEERIPAFFRDSDL